jgi:hypothetical protein
MLSRKKNFFLLSSSGIIRIFHLHPPQVNEYNAKNETGEERKKLKKKTEIK